MEKTEIVEMLSKQTPKVKLEEITAGKRYQFAGDRCRVREVEEVEGENVLVRTLGDVSEPKFYKVHYSWLYPNTTPLSYLR